MVQFHEMELNLITLPCQNLAFIGPICTKRKAMFKLTKSVKVHYKFENVALLVHIAKWNYLFPLIRIGLLPYWIESHLYNEFFPINNYCAKAWCPSKF